MKKIPSMTNDSSSALERTYLSWQRLSLGLLAMSVFSLKLISLNSNYVNAAVAIIAFVGALAFSVINFFFFHKINTIFLLLFCFFIANLIALITLLEAI